MWGIFNQAIGTALQVLQHLGEKLLQPGVLGVGEEGLGLVLLGDDALVHKQHPGGHARGQSPSRG